MIMTMMTMMDATYLFQPLHNSLQLVASHGTFPRSVGAAPPLIPWQHLAAPWRGRTWCRKTSPEGSMKKTVP